MSEQRYLRKAKGSNNSVHIYTKILADRGDMVECDKNGAFVRDIAQETPQVAPEAASQANETKAELVAIARDRFKLDVVEDMPTAAIVDAMLSAYETELDAKPAIDKMTKAELVAYAKENFGVELDADLKVGDLRLQVKALAENPE